VKVKSSNNTRRSLLLYWYTFRELVIAVSTNVYTVIKVLYQPVSAQREPRLNSEHNLSLLHRQALVRGGVLLLILIGTYLSWKDFVAKPIQSAWNSNQGSSGSAQITNATGSTAISGGAVVEGGTGRLISNSSQTHPYDTILYDNLYRNEEAQFSEQLDRAYDHVVERFEHSATTRFTVEIGRDYDCNLHGLADAGKRRIQLLTCETISHQRGIAILAHEFVHQLAYDRYGPDSPGADRILAEGMATWAADTYWLGGHPNFKSYVRQQRASGVFYPLTTDYVTAGSHALDPLYYEWASFVDYLITTYGRSKFDQVYTSDSLNGMPGSANYEAAYDGKSIAVLEQEWLAWLDR
jgi:hypothetical protein